MPWGMPLQGYPPNVYDFNIPYNVFQGQGFATGLGQFDYNTNLRMNNDIHHRHFPFHQHLQPSYNNPVVNVSSHPQNLTQQSSSSINPVSVNHTTQKVPSVRTENSLGSAEQPSTSYASTPGHRDVAPTGILVCFQ